MDWKKKIGLKKENTEIEQEISMLKEEDTLFKNKNFIGKAAYIVALCMAIYHIYTTMFGIPASMVHRPIHFGFALIIMFLVYDKKGRRGTKEKLTFIEYIGIALTIGMVAFYLINRRYLMTYMWYITPVTTKAILITAVVLFLALYSGKRMVGKIFIGVSISFIIYAWAGKYLPGILEHRGIALNKFCDTMALISEGVFGMAMGVSATYIFNFILFGAFLKASKAGQFFIDISMALAGRSRGGPAKVAVFSSAFVGTISGSVIANVLTTGSFSIPLMKKLGYKKEFAGAVEATASTGGMIMPPIMGATAFLVAELAGVPYAKLCIYAIFPAILYFASLLIMIDLEAAKLGLKGMKKSEIPNAMDVIKKGWYKIIPLIVLIVTIFMGYSPLKCGLYGIISIIVVSWFDPENRLGIKKIIDALVEGATNCVQVAAACACAGIVVGITSQTGLGFRMADAFMRLSGGILLPSLFFCAVVAIILGMGLTVTPAYVVVAALVAPLLIKLGLMPVQAHLFCFYFACLCAITPPVALGSFAAAGIADADPMKTGFIGVRLASSLYIVPFMFAYSPELILVGKVHNIVIAIITSLIGIYCLSIAAEGYLFKRVSIPLRIIIFATGLTLIYPGIATDIIGVSAFAVFFIISWLANKNSGNKLKTA